MFRSLMILNIAKFQEDHPICEGGGAVSSAARAIPLS